MARILPAAAAAALLAVSCSGGPMSALSDFEGSWEGTHRLAGDETVYAAAYEIHEDKGALIWDFRSDWGGGFTGRGVQLWNQSRGEYDETWTDASQAEPTLMRGAWDAASSTLSMYSEGADWESGVIITYEHRTVRHSADHWSYVMIADRSDGPVEVMWIEMKRK